MNNHQPDKIDNKLDQLFNQARQDSSPHGAVRDYGFETRLKNSLGNQIGRHSGLDGFGSMCWRLGWVGLSAVAILLAVSTMVFDTNQIGAMLTTSSDFLGANLLHF